MYKKANKKSILLLLVINFILLSLLDIPIDIRAVNKTVYQYKDHQIDIINKKELGIPQLESVEYELCDGTIINITEENAKKLDELRELAIKKQEELAIKQEQARQKVTVESVRQIKSESINVYTDLSVMNTITTEDINKIIDYWNSKMSVSTPFKNKGQAFIDASKETGLDPIYILAHAALESGWGKSEIARAKYNYYGIGAFDNSPYESSYTIADNVYEGIVEGAKWIDRNYYENGQTSLYTMRYNNGHHEYCTSTTWMYDIVDIMQVSYNLIQ